MKSLWSVFAVLVGFFHAGAVARADSLQERIDAAAPGDEVVVPAGFYSGAIVVRDGIALIGDGADSTVLDGGGQPCVVTMGKDASIGGFTVQNGVVGIANSNESFFSVFDCRIVDNQHYGIRVQGGSAVIVSNLIARTRQLAGVLCLNANPYIMDNVIQDNPIGVVVGGKLTPTIVDNIFVGNQTGIRLNQATAILGGNTFDRNAVNIVGGTLDPTDRIAQVDLASLKPYRSKPGRYGSLIARIRDQVLGEHPMVIYTLSDTEGQFLVATLFPWATFTVGSATRDTKIVDPFAYDAATQDRLATERVVLQERPGVAVKSDTHPDAPANRYVLDMIYEHGASYAAVEEGMRRFTRLTTFANIRIVLPDGWVAVSSKPAGTTEMVNGRQVVSIRDCGHTTVDLLIAPVK
jgi:hypothetical protein